jgi:hypothetical protein
MPFTLPGTDAGTEAEVQIGTMDDAKHLGGAFALCRPEATD